ncbi:Putative ABC transporter [Acididesulfobacillus acetoxydans]|uniref:ABC transporter n=1 Tax=Acididesulfobacillus acetoxydans TaxID=1561005 RepID=A0A8S0WFS6_9FIRM|nr:sugar ABC transporter ATP-binding protein [Acididesulfobacillus acetoxydans]CAA7601312.1 Putative ABC transporter [Acididesulfobacillus acetoxydans]CEJ08778.1 Ribose import ATP-binding protein RbsA [Acididesulfobacillus acetoxydans]
MCDCVLQIRGMTKVFSGVKALDSVSFDLKAGEVHALMGENGAGKSTFIKVITGVYQPDGGVIILNGRQVQINNPKDAQKFGIAAIYQHVTCYPDLTVTENIFMDHLEVSPKTGRILWKRMHAKAADLLRHLSSEIDPKTLMSELSVAQQQIIEIAKAISTHANIIIMDEPTAALTKNESEDLYKITDQLRNSGASIIFISHRFEDFHRVADRVTILRDSQYIGTWGVNEISEEELIVAMVGREIKQMFPPKTAVAREEILRVKGLTKTGYFSDVSITVKRGEIVALTGLVGAGRTEICETLFGIMKPDKGEVYFENKKIRIVDPNTSMKLGIGYLPEDRQVQGLIMNWSIQKNITVSRLEMFSNRGWLRPDLERSKAEELASMVNVKAKSVNAPALSLSGGNQQKVIVAKLLLADLKLIILDEPTKGIDVGAKYAIYEIMDNLAAQGYGILMVSSELPEVLGMADRIVVIRRGRVSKTFSRRDATPEKVLEAAMPIETAALCQE